MAKSIYAVAGIGIGSCVVLSLMMQHLLKVRGERSRPAYVLELEELHAGRLVAPVEVREEKVDGKKRLILHLRVLAGLQKQRIAQTAGNTVWRRLAGEKDAPDRIDVEICDDLDDTPLVVPIARAPQFGAEPPATGAKKLPAPRTPSSTTSAPHGIGSAPKPDAVQPVPPKASAPPR